MSSQEYNDTVNIEELKKIMDHDLEMIQGCFNDFLEEWPAQYNAIKDAVTDQNAAKLNESAHKLKGTLRYLAAEAATQAAASLETAGKENDLSGADIKLNALKKQCQKLVEFIHHFNR